MGEKIKIENKDFFNIVLVTSFPTIICMLRSGIGMQKDVETRRNMSFSAYASTLETCAYEFVVCIGLCLLFAWKIGRLRRCIQAWGSIIRREEIWKREEKEREI